MKIDKLGLLRVGFTVWNDFKSYVRSNWKAVVFWCIRALPQLPGALLAFATMLAMLWTFAVVARRFAGATTPELTSIIQTVIWPLVTVIALILLRRPIIAFFSGISQRVTKLSAFNVELELVAVTATEAKSPGINELRRSASMLVGDSGAQIFAQLKEETPADYVIIELGAGQEWLTSRLFIVSALFEQMRGVRCMAFVDGAGADAGRFIGTAGVHAVRWKLARNYPWYEIAFAHALVSAFPDDPSDMPPNRQIFRDDRGGFEPLDANRVTQAFIARMQNKPQQHNLGWIKIREHPDVWERADWVNPNMLRQLLGTSLNKSSVTGVGRSRSEEVVREVLSRSGPFVAGLNGDKLEELIDRAALLEELGRKTAAAH